MKRIIRVTCTSLVFHILAGCDSEVKKEISVVPVKPDAESTREPAGHRNAAEPADQGDDEVDLEDEFRRLTEPYHETDE